MTQKPRNQSAPASTPRSPSARHWLRTRSRIAGVVGLAALLACLGLWHYWRANESPSARQQPIAAATKREFPGAHSQQRQNPGNAQALPAAARTSDVAQQLVADTTTPTSPSPKPTNPDDTISPYLPMQLGHTLKILGLPIPEGFPSDSDSSVPAQ